MMINKNYDNYDNNDNYDDDQQKQKGACSNSGILDPIFYDDHNDDYHWLIMIIIIGWLSRTQ